MTVRVRVRVGLGWARLFVPEGPPLQIHVRVWFRVRVLVRVRVQVPVLPRARLRLVCGIRHTEPAEASNKSRIG